MANDQPTAPTDDYKGPTVGEVKEALAASADSAMEAVLDAPVHEIADRCAQLPTQDHRIAVMIGLGLLRPSVTGEATRVVIESRTSEQLTYDTTLLGRLGISVKERWLACVVPHVAAADIRALFTWRHAGSILALAASHYLAQAPTTGGIHRDPLVS